MSEAAGTVSLSRYAPRARAWVVAAQALADELQHAEVAPLHLLARGLEREPQIATVFQSAGVDAAALLARAQTALGSVDKSREPAYLSLALLNLLRRAERDAERSSGNPLEQVQVGNLLNALSQEVKGPVAQLLGDHGVGPGSLRAHAASLVNAPAPGNGRSQTGSRNTSEWTLDLVARARAGADPVVGRQDEIRRLLTILERRDKSNPLLVGESGVGKRALVRAVADRIARGEVPAGLREVKLFELDVGALSSGARSRAEVELRFKQLLEELSAKGSANVLVLPALWSALGSNPTGMGLAEPLTSALGRGALRVLATTEPEGLTRLLTKEAQLARQFTVLEVEEPHLSEATEIVRGSAGRYERHHDVKIAESAVISAVQLAKRYLQDRHLPDSALDLLDESAARLRVDATSAARPPTAESAGGQAPAGVETSSLVLEEQHVAATLAAWTRIPVSKMLEGETEKLLKMEERLAQRVVGQEAAVRSIAKAVRRGRVGLRDARRPIGSFLFLGSSGVGKTELAKALASFLFDDEHSLTRLDMSEFMERHMAQRLLGAPVGYADSEQGGFLTEAVRKRPYSVLLFDEVEKAHQDVFNLLLQVLDDGRLTDGRGRVADFTNTVVILTSNIGSDRISEAAPTVFETEAGREALRDVLLERLEGFFRPEFLNRIGDIVVFRPLSKPDLLKVADIQLAQLNRMLEAKGLKLAVDDAVKQHLVDESYEPALGARPLQRTIVRHLQDPLAEALLTGGFEPGHTVWVSLKDGQPHFRAEPSDAGGSPPHRA